jgi:hypothetical protein
MPAYHTLPLRTRIGLALTARRNPWTPVLQAVLVLGLFTGVRSLVKLSWPAMEESAYGEAWLLGQLLSRPGPMIATVAWVFVAALGWQRWGWRRLEVRPASRVIVTAAALALAWAFSAFTHNYRYGQLHLFDRLFLIAMAVGVWFHPAFAFGVAIASKVLIDQFWHPLPRWSTTDYRMVEEVIWLFMACLLARLITRRFRFSLFVFLTLCLVGANYLAPGIEKLRFDWLASNDLTNIFRANRLNGWLACLTPGQADRLLAVLAVLNTPMLIFTLIVELGALLMLLRRWLAVALLGSLIALHLGIFVASGILFWKWIIIDLALISSLLIMRRRDRSEVFNRRLFLISLLIIGLGPHWFNVNWLGWRDSSAVNHFRIEAVGQSGRIYEIPRCDLQPYDKPAAQGRFFFLSDEPTVVWTGGAVFNDQAVRQIAQAETPEQMRQVEHEFGRVYRNPEGRDGLVVLLTQFGRYANANGHLPDSPPQWLRPPHHIWTGPATDRPRFTAQEPIVAIRVRLVSRWRYDGEWKVYRNRVVEVIPIPRK